MKFVARLFLVLCVNPVLALAADPSPITLGQSAPFSGPSGQFGRQMWLGAQTYFDEVNRRGGVRGRKIVVKALDDQYNVDLAQQNTAKLLQEPDLFALFGYVGTPTTLKALPELAKARKNGFAGFLFGVRSGAEQLRSPPFAEMVYNIRASYAEETEALVKSLTGRGAKRIAVFLQDDSYGESGRAGIAAALRKRGLEIVAEARYPRGAKFQESMGEQAKTLLGKRADAVISIASYEAAAAFVRDIREQKFRGPVANISFVGSSDMLKLLVEEGAKRKKDFTESLINSQVVPSTAEAKIPLIAEYLKLSGSAAPKAPDSISHGEIIRKISFTGAEGFLAAKIFVATLEKIDGDITPQAFQRVAAGKIDLDVGLGYPVNFSPEIHQALHEVYLTEVKGGKFVPFKR